jgi:hypothetical protein
MATSRDTTLSFGNFYLPFYGFGTPVAPLGGTRRGLHIIL